MALIWRTAALILVIGLAACDAAPDQKVATPTAPAAASPASAALVALRVGQHMGTDSLDIFFDPIRTAKKVGIPYASQAAAEGGILVVVTYAIKNIGTKPVEASDMPAIKLIDSAGVEYEEDAGATGAYMMAHKVDQKLWSALNPGITIKGAKVFEVSEAAFNPATWAISLSGDRVALQ